LPSIPNVSSLVCDTGSCRITACPASRKNNDGNVCTGCEATTCTDNPPTNTCGTAVPLTIGDKTGQILTAGATAWFVVSFNQPAPGQLFTPTVRLLAGPPEYRVDFFEGCASSTPNAACPGPGGHPGQGGGSPSNALTWSMNFNGSTMPCGGASQAACTNTSSLPSAGLYVRLTRTQVTADECAPYTLQVTQ
jgi:hypothetical protein